MAGLELHDAAASGDVDTLEALLRSGKFDINLQDEEWHNQTALHWACSRGYVDCIRMLLEYGARGTSRIVGGWTPAHCAAETGKLHALRALAAANIPVDKPDKYGDTPKRIAQIYGHHECVRFLVQMELEQAEKRREGKLLDEEEDQCVSDTADC